MANLINCGILDSGIGLSELKCDPRTGEVIYCDDLNGNCVLSNISVMNPVELNFDIYEKLLSQVSGRGIIITTDHVIVLQEDTAEYREVKDATIVVHTVSYDTDVVYEGSVE